MPDYEPLTAAEIRTALEQLNWSYGIGDVITVNPISSGTNVNGTGTFDRKPWGMNLQTRTYRIIGRTVKALNHQTTIQ